MEKLKKEIIEDLKEIDFILWQNLITINIFLSTAFVAFLTFSNISSNYLFRLINGLGLILSVTACVILITNLIRTKEVYKDIIKQVDTGNVPIGEESKRLQNNANTAFYKNEYFEDKAIKFMLISFILLVIILFFGFLIQRPEIHSSIQHFSHFHNL